MKPHPSCYNGAILKKLAIFLRKVTNGLGRQQAYGKSLRFFTFSRDAARKTNVFAVREVPLGWMEAVAFVNWLLVAYHHPSCKGTVLKLATAQSVKRTWAIKQTFSLSMGFG